VLLPFAAAIMVAIKPIISIVLSITFSHNTDRIYFLLALVGHKRGK
jgi:hypothetical protein